jgi:hypothetical protein
MNARVKGATRWFLNNRAQHKKGLFASHQRNRGEAIRPIRRRPIGRGPTVEVG